MPFNYRKMQKVADKLVSKTKFGGPFTLLRSEGTSYDPIKKKNVATYSEYKGNCVKKVYKDEGQGRLKDIVGAGDLEFKCVMQDLSITPVKSKDKIVFEGVTYNIIEVDTIEPDGKHILVHTCYARKASN